VLPSRSRSLMSTSESRSIVTTPSWPLSMETWSRGLLSPLSDELYVCVGDGVCLRDKAGVGGTAVLERLGRDDALRLSSGCDRRPGKMLEGVVWLSAAPVDGLGVGRDSSSTGREGVSELCGFHPKVWSLMEWPRECLPNSASKLKLSPTVLLQSRPESEE